MTNTFKCFRCGEIFDRQSHSKVDDELCKYCEELDNENGEYKE